MEPQLFTKRQYTKPQLLEIFNYFVRFEEVDKARKNLSVIFPGENVDLYPGADGTYVNGRMCVGDYSLVW